MHLEDILQQYDYEVPESAIAQVPRNPRDSAKLLVYDRATGETQYDTYANLGSYLPPHSLLVLNNTKVVPARLFGTTPTGGKVEILCTSGFDAENHIHALLNKNLKPNTIITISETLSLRVIARPDKEFILDPSWQRAHHTDVLLTYGHTPIPPYIKHSPLSETELRTTYQTTFAQESGSVAAPTASLHFTPELLSTLEQQGHEIVFVTLHVNLGTFAPLTEKHLTEGTLHTERYMMPPETHAAIMRARADGRPVVAVGTTAARTIESVARAHQLSGHTNIFIREGYEWQWVTALITNFHVPRSSLLMLVATLTGKEKMLALYKQALTRGFTFFSFGDGMFIR